MGANSVEVAAAAGKASVESLLPYQRISPGRNRELVEKLQILYPSCVKLVPKTDLTN